MSLHLAVDSPWVDLPQVSFVVLFGPTWSVMRSDKRTERAAVRLACSIFVGHYQPSRPALDNDGDLEQVDEYSPRKNDALD